MADLPVKQQFLASPNLEVEKMWIDVQIQERRSRIIKTRQDIEDLIKAHKVKLEAQIIMLEKEIAFLEEKKATLTVTDLEASS